MTTEKLYPLNAYGSAMAPLFISLSLWIGTLMLCAILKLEVDKEGVPGLTVMQGYIGRWLFFALLATLQAVVCVAGCLLIGVRRHRCGVFRNGGFTVPFLPVHHVHAVIVVPAYRHRPMHHHGVRPDPGRHGFVPGRDDRRLLPHGIPHVPFTYGINALRETIGGSTARSGWVLRGAAAHCAAMVAGRPVRATAI